MTAPTSNQAVALDEAQPERPDFPKVEGYWEATPGLANAMTCDVEDYFQVSAFENLIDRTSWGDYECRIPANIDRILQILDDAGVSGTFFTLAWVAEHFPETVRRIADEGHEVASHGMQHIRVWNQSREQFLEDARRSKQILEDVSGQAVRGYRAASWSMDPRTHWAHEVLGEIGYVYSSSIYPVAHDHYGVPSAPRQPFYTSGNLLEIPATAARLMGRNLPSAGGGWFRLMPLPLSKRLMRRFRKQTGAPAMFYFHPWEIDPSQPRVENARRIDRVRHYLNLSRFEQRFIDLLKAFEWGRMDDIFLGRESRPVTTSG